MKLTLILSLALLWATISNAQSVQRKINFNYFDKDSVSISFNASYYLVEDSCAQIIRHIRGDVSSRKFHGHFTDFNKANPTIIVAEGSYSEDGLKEGGFIMRYPDGSMEAKGEFRNDRPVGYWEVFYPDKKPKLNFQEKDGVYVIKDAWNTDGSKLINSGNGSYVVNLDALTWKGKLVNGSPDGTWKMYQTNDPDKQTIATEKFKNGKFVSGSNQIGEYTDASRISLLSTDTFPILNAEKFQIGEPCTMPGIENKNNGVISAHHKGGQQSLTIDITEALRNYFSHVNINDVETNFSLTGIVDADGHFGHFAKSGSYLAGVAEGIMGELHSLPKIEPATVNGKPVAQQFKIFVKLTKGSFEFQYEFGRVAKP